MGLKRRGRNAVMFQRVQQAALVKAYVMGHHMLTNNVMLQGGPHFVKGQGAGSHSGGNAMDADVKRIVVIVWWPYQYIDLVHYLAFNHTYQAYLADAVAVSVCGLKVNGGKGLSGHFNRCDRSESRKVKKKKAMADVKMSDG